MLEVELIHLIELHCFALVPTFNVEAVPNPEIFVLAIEFTVNDIFPLDVTGELPTVNSEAPPSAIPTEVTVPELFGVTTT